MKPITAAVILIVAIVVVGTTVVFYPRGTTNGSSTTSSSSTSSGTSTLGSNGLELRLALNATDVRPGSALLVTVSEFNTRPVVNNVTKADLWGVQGLSLGACESEAYGIYPFGVAVYKGSYTSADLSQGTPIQVFPPVPCPLMLRLVTGYLFQPMNDSAVILPSSSSVATPMSANVTVSGQYSGGSLQRFAPGVYTVVAGDEWGALETVQFTVSGSPVSTTTSSSAAQGENGTLAASIGIGPIAPVCMANATVGPAPQSYSSIKAVITTSSGSNMTLPVQWTSNGCEVSGSFQASLSPGAYTLSLSPCTYMGCSASVPKAFSISSGLTSQVMVSIDTGIR